MFLGALRARDTRTVQRVWSELVAPPTRRRAPDLFDPAIIAELPEPARRYFGYMIEPGAALCPIVELEMHGELGLGTRETPRYIPMRARQILAPPSGFVWEITAGAVTGSDGANGETSWTRFWYRGWLPVARAGGDADHWRSAFGRVVAEGLMWAPAALLPSPAVSWEAPAPDTARVRVRHRGVEQTADVVVADDGRPVRIELPRWSAANPEKRYRVQPFGGYPSSWQAYRGLRVPMQAEGGNFIGTEDYFPFFRVTLDSFRFPTRDP
jgi:hypothetical protein